MALSNIAGEEPSTITFRLATVTHDRGSTTEHQEIVVLGGAASSLAIAQVLDATPASTVWALAVREVAHSTTVNVSSLAGAVIVRSSAANALVSVYQSTAADLNVTVAGYVAPSTTVSVSTGSVRVHQSTQADLRATMYQSTAADLNVTVAGYVAPSTIVTVSTGSVRVHQSTQADLRATVYQSTAADLNVTVAGYVAPSTIVTVSTGSVRVHQSTQADLRATVYQSTAADLNVTVAGYSTTVNVSSLAGAVQARVFTSSGGSVEGSTSLPSTNALGLHVRQVMPPRLSTSILAYIQTAAGSTEIVSSVAARPCRVSAFSVMSTVVGFSSCAFLSSAAKERWAILLGSGSSGITGANLAVSQPGSIFETDASEALNFSASSSGYYRVSVSYWHEL